MPLNFDHSKNHSVSLISKDLQNSGIFKFPKNNSQNPVEILISGKPNVSYISGLSNCLSLISGGYSGLYYTNDINGNCSYSYAVDSGSVAQVCNSIIFGSNGVAKLNYCHGETGAQPNSNGPIHSQIVHSIPSFNLNGETQNINFLSKATVLNNSGKYLVCGTVNCDTIAYGNFDIIGKGFNETGRFGVFNVKASLFRTSGACIYTGYFNLNTVANCNLNPSFNISITGSNNAGWGLSVCNASGMQWLTRASVLEMTITGLEYVNTTGIYWKCTADSGWFNLNNWFSNQYSTVALSYPTSSTDVIMSGNCAAYTNMDCNLWIQPNSIDTTKITDPKGICLYSNEGKVFSNNIYGNVTLYGNAIFGEISEGIYWRNEVDINWFNLYNWFVESSFQNEADALPLSTSDVFMYGNAAACINMDCNLWVQPHSINTTNSTSVDKLYIYSENSCSFSGIIYGSVTLSGNANFK